MLDKDRFPPSPYTPIGRLFGFLDTAPETTIELLTKKIKEITSPPPDDEEESEAAEAIEDEIELERELNADDDDDEDEEDNRRGYTSSWASTSPEPEAEAEVDDFQKPIIEAIDTFFERFEEVDLESDQGKLFMTRIKFIPIGTEEAVATWLDKYTREIIKILPII